MKYINGARKAEWVVVKYWKHWFCLLVPMLVWNEFTGESGETIDMSVLRIIPELKQCQYK